MPHASISALTVILSTPFCFAIVANVPAMTFFVSTGMELPLLFA